MINTKQKRIAVVNDITGFGRCSVSVAQPIISAMKIQCCAVPTAILSSHTGFKGYVFDDYTERIPDYIKNWEELGIEFDGIATGFLGSAKQIEIILDFIKRFRKEKTTVLVDPVMGDYGKLYSTYTDEMCDEMKKLVREADVVTPNLTEACRLLDMEYPEEIPGKEELLNIASKISKMGPKKVVITGMEYKENLINVVYENLGDKEVERIISTPKIGVYRSGTGDVFSSIVIGSLVNGSDFEYAVQKAVNYINKCIKYTQEIGAYEYSGLCFEEYLHELA